MIVLGAIGVVLIGLGLLLLIARQIALIWIDIADFVHGFEVEQ